MKRNLTLKETVAITSMLFGMFFGAGNLIFPAMLGVVSGANLWPAFAGVFVTAVGIPMLAVVVLGLSRCDGVLSLASKVSPKFGLLFSCLLYLTIGPLFAIPRCASTSFAVGAIHLIPEQYQTISLAIFSGVFFIAILFFSLKPGNIMTWIGKILNPIFLCFLAVLIVTALLHPITQISEVTPTIAYSTASSAFFKGFLEGYNTLDALAGLAFGIVIVNVIRSHGVEEPEYVALNTARSGIFACLLMGIVYLFIALISTQSAPLCLACVDGGEVLGTISNYYFHSVGTILMTVIVTCACLKTAVGLVISCSEAFIQMFPHGPRYTVWACLFSVVSFLIANLGLSTIVAWCVPVLMFLYPLAITMILLVLLNGIIRIGRIVYILTITLTFTASVFAMIGAIYDLLPENDVLAVITSFAGDVIPLYNIGLGWVIPAVLGCFVGLIIDNTRKMLSV